MSSISGKKRTVDLDDDRQRILTESVRGTFDSSPLLNSRHVLPCKNCGSEKHLVYLNYLKTGRFSLGETKPIEIQHPYASGYAFQMEEATPIIIREKCNKCGCAIEVSPVSKEYLFFIIGKKGSNRLFYG